MKQFIFIIILLAIIFPVASYADTGHLVISEIQIYGQTATDEFVRAYNPTGAAIDISGWRLTKKTSSGAESNLVAKFPDNTSIPANSGFLIAHQTGYQGSEAPDARYSGASYSIAANNTVILKNAEGAVIDKVGFGTAADYEGAPADNPENSASIKRINNEDTDNNKNDFLPHPASPSSGGGEASDSNASAETAPVGTGLKPVPTTSAQANYGDIVINEVMPNPAEGPAGGGVNKEWIEFFNATESDLDVSGWKVDDGSNEIYTLSGTIAAKSFLTIEFNNRLNNSGDIIYLSDANNYSIAQFAYGGWYDGNLSDNAPAPKKGQAIARQADGSYVVTDSSTKNQENIFSEETLPLLRQGYEGQAASPSAGEGEIDYTQVVISEIVPNPEGADTENEYIKLYNNGSEDIDIGVLYLDDAEGGSRPYYIPKETIIKAQNYLIFYSAKTKISLNNSNDSARLLDKNKEELQAVEYDDAKEGVAYIFKDGKWAWASAKTSSIPVIPAQAGIPSNSITGIVIVLPNTFNKTTMYVDGKQLYMYSADWPELKIGDKIRVYGTPSTYYNEPRLKLKNKNSIIIISHNNPASGTPISAEEIEDENVGKLIILEGDVLKITSQKIIIESDGEEIEVLNKASMNFSLLKAGDKIKISGVLSKYKENYRIIPRTSDDIKMLSTTEKNKEPVDANNFPWQYVISTLGIGALSGAVYYKRRRKKNAPAEYTKTLGQ